MGDLEAALAVEEVDDNSWTATARESGFGSDVCGSDP
jgi:hypothetical protein